MRAWDSETAFGNTVGQAENTGNDFLPFQSSGETQEIHYYVNCPHDMTEMNIESSVKHHSIINHVSWTTYTILRNIKFVILKSLQIKLVENFELTLLQISPCF